MRKLILLKDYDTDTLNECPYFYDLIDVKIKYTNLKIKICNLFLDLKEYNIDISKFKLLYKLSGLNKDNDEYITKKIDDYNSYIKEYCRFRKSHIEINDECVIFRGPNYYSLQLSLNYDHPPFIQHKLDLIQDKILNFYNIDYDKNG